MIGRRVLEIAAWLVIAVGLSELAAARGVILALASQELSVWVTEEIARR